MVLFCLSHTRAFSSHLTFEYLLSWVNSSKMWHREAIYTFPGLCFARKPFPLHGSLFRKFHVLHSMYLPSLGLIQSTVFEYAITHTHTGNSMLFPGLSEKVRSQGSKSRCSWFWHARFRILDGRTRLEVYQAYSAPALANNHIFMTKDSRVCLLCWAGRPPPGLHGKWLSIIWEKYLICSRGHVEEGRFAVGSKSGMRAGAIAAAALNQIWPCLMFKEPKMFGININKHYGLSNMLTFHKEGGTPWPIQSPFIEHLLCTPDSVLDAGDE